MFEVGDYVVFGTDGVCQVESIGPLEMDGVAKDKIYYTLAPLGKVGSSRIFSPVDSRRVVMRKVISTEEARDLIAGIAKIDKIKVADERKREETYKQVLQSCDCVSIIGLIKEIAARRDQRIAQGKKLPAVDERYFNMAENSLYSELSLPLKLDKAEVKDYIYRIVGRTA